ncbi:MAG: hypothetical protein J6M39_00255 [Lachnospiraceae bacterium]|nr:hypothetical protein [Lachnospiraceae bacterium]
MKKNKIFLFVLIILIVTIGIIIVRKVTETYPLNVNGKYNDYIKYAVEENNKQLKKQKINKMNYIYANVIYEMEVDKDKLSQLSDNSDIAEYLVCVIDENKNENYFMCQIPYVKWKSTLNDQLNIAKLDMDSIIAEGIKGGTDIAGAVDSSSKSNKKAEKGILSKIGNVVGGYIGGLFDQKKAGEQVGEFVGDIAPSVIDAVKDIWTNVTTQNKENEIKLNEFISLMSEEDYKGTLEQFASIMKPNISSIDKIDLNKYITSGSINLLNKTINKIVK